MEQNLKLKFTKMFLINLLIKRYDLFQILFRLVQLIFFSPFLFSEENEEKTKNFKILESILGYGVSENYPEGKNPLK